MAKIDLVMPKMGESIMEATILKWVKKVGDTVEEDETILEIATDKVDSEIPAPVSGIITEIFHKEDEVVEVGKVIAVISTEGEEAAAPSSSEKAPEKPAAKKEKIQEELPQAAPTSPSNPKPKTVVQQPIAVPQPATGSIRFYSPLVKSIAKKENISQTELESVSGSGAKGRVTKKDIMNYVRQRSNGGSHAVVSKSSSNGHKTTNGVSSISPASAPTFSSDGRTEIVQMDRMRKLIADHMVMSKHTSPHVTSFVEADVTNLANWREANKNDYVKQYGEKITYTPIFIEAVVKALKDFPMVNVSVDGDKIVVKKDLNVGMATALPSGNLIVPVIKNADFLNLNGLTRQVNDLASRARNNKLKPEDIQGGTFTVTNVGTFGNVMGTPIINQPQVAILALGAIRKKPAVLETKDGDVIAIRKMMFLSLSYDHRVVDGFLGGSFLRRIADYLEGFDSTRSI